MGFIKGIAATNEVLAKKNTGGDFEDRPKTVWFSQKDGDSAKIVFLQELDEGSPNFSEKNGVAHFVLEHSNPDNWRKRAECTADEGACYGCENGWVQKVQLYINVLVDDGKKDPYVAVLSRGTGKGSLSKQLLEIAADAEFDNSISDKQFKLGRSGSTKDDTTYTLTNMGPRKVKDIEAFELFDLDHVPFKVKYDKQEAYYLDGQESKPREEAKPQSASGVDSDW